MNCSSRPIESCQKSVAGRLDLGSSEPRQLAAKYHVVGVEKLSPTSVTHSFRMLGRADDIGNQDCGQDALVSERRLCASEEFNDLVCDLIGVITKEWKMIDSRQFQKPGVRNAIGQLPPAFDVDHWIVDPVNDKGWNAYVWKNA